MVRYRHNISVTMALSAKNRYGRMGVIEPQPAAPAVPAVPAVNSGDAWSRLS